MRRLIARLAQALWLTTAVSAPAKTAQPKARQDNLRRAADAMSYVLQNSSAFTQPSPDQRTRILQALSTLESLSHGAKTASALKSSIDPIMRYQSLDLPAKFAQVASVYNHGSYAHARYLFRQTTHYCVSCHAVASPVNPGPLPFPAPAPGLSELERADYLTSIRKHKEAILVYERVLINASFRSAQPQVWELALQKLLGITIRMRNDAHITLETASRLLETSGLSQAQRDLLLAWRNSAKNWTREKLNPKLRGAALITKVQQLIDLGNSLSLKDRSYGFVEYLRAMNLINQLAVSGETEMLKASGFRIAGEISEKLQEGSVWMYPEAYYEACIRALPHSSEAQQCWHNFKSYHARNRFTLWDRNLTQQLQGLAF